MTLKSHTTKLLMAMLVACVCQTGAHAAADPSKVLHVALEAADDGFNLDRTNSLYSNWIAEAVFEGLLTYDYLARPAKMVPNTAEAMPEITDSGKTYTFHIKKGIYFTSDPAFKGKKRELTAMDYAYAIKRHFDPKLHSPQQVNFIGKIVGLDAFAEKAKTTGKFDYDAPIAGIETPDRYTLRLHLNNVDYTLPYYFANVTSAPIAREVVDYYGEDALGQHPVGTGPYMLKQYVPRSKIILEANPDWRGKTWDFEPHDAWDEQLVRDMKGKRLPLIGRVEVSIIEEDQARWLAFDSAQSDLEYLSPPAAPGVLDGDKLKPQFARRGIKLYRFVEPGIYYTYFNMKDPVVGGYTKEKIALRRALAMAYRVDDEIAQMWFGQAIRAESLIPPGVAGYDPKYRSSIPYDPALAEKLLDYFGYKRGADGWRTMPDGKPLVLKVYSDQRSRDATKREIWKRSLDRIGIHTEFPVSSFADNLQAAYRCELPMWGLGGTAGIPDGIDFMDPYFSGNAYQGNFGCYESKAFDDAYHASKQLPDGPERNALYERMTRILEADTTQFSEVSRIRNWLSHPWVKGFKKHPIINADWMYLDIDKH